MRIGNTDYNKYKNYIELFTKMNVNNQRKNNNIYSSTIEKADKIKPYVDFPYTKEMSGWYHGNDLKALLTGHLKNSYGVEGMDITGKSNYKKIVNVSDNMKALVLNEVKRSFYKYNGMCGDNSKEIDSYYYQINEYLKTLDIKDRLPASYTISQMDGDLTKSVLDAVKQRIPGWIEGKPIPSEVLDNIFSDKKIVGDFADIKNLKGRIDEII